MLGEGAGGRGRVINKGSHGAGTSAQVCHMHYRDRLCRGPQKCSGHRPQLQGTWGW